MAIIVCEGLDRVGKSTIAAYFETLGFHIIHMSAPAKHHTQDSFLQEMIDLVTSAATKDIFLDRSYYGEAFIWPEVYGRKPLLDEEAINMIREVEDSVGVQRIWMTDNSVEAHWKRCVDNKEPLNKAQFVRARALFSDMAHKYGFEPITLQQFMKKFPDSEQFNNPTTPAPAQQEAKLESPSAVQPAKMDGKSPEQHKLEMANAINDVLSKRILKAKGDTYDNIENEIRSFLNSKLGKLLGSSSNEPTLSPEEIKFYKAMYKKAIQGDR